MPHPPPPSALEQAGRARYANGHSRFVSPALSILSLIHSLHTLTHSLSPHSHSLPLSTLSLTHSLHTLSHSLSPHSLSLPFSTLSLTHSLHAFTHSLSPHSLSLPLSTGWTFSRSRSAGVASLPARQVRPSVSFLCGSNCGWGLAISRGQRLKFDGPVDRKSSVRPQFDPLGHLAPPSPFFENVQCVSETEILGEKKKTQGVLVCDHAGLTQ